MTAPRRWDRRLDRRLLVEQRRPLGALASPEAVTETEHAGTCRSRTALAGHQRSLTADCCWVG